MNNRQIDASLKDIKSYKGCIFKDAINRKTRNGSYVVNMDNSDGAGTHWCGLVLTTNIGYWYDSFGVHPPEETKVLKRTNRKVYFNSDQLQSVIAKTCGAWCVDFIKHMNDTKNDYQGYIDRYRHGETEYNEKKLKSNS